MPINSPTVVCLLVFQCCANSHLSNACADRKDIGKKNYTRMIFKMLILVWLNVAAVDLSPSGIHGAAVHGVTCFSPGLCSECFTICSGIFP